MPRELPPLVPAEVELRDFPFTPILRSRLFGSEFHANATDAEWRAGVTLWLKSWDQVPAGTLPPGEVELCRLAELGRDLEAWRALSPRALHGWKLCSDGRLHHAVVAEGVLKAWSKRKKASIKGKAGAAARWGDPPPENGTGNAHAIAQAMPTPMPNDSNRQGEGRDKEEDTENLPDRPVGQNSPNALVARGTRWPPDQAVPEDWLQAAGMKRTELGMPAIDLPVIAAMFANYWSAKAGGAATKVDWRKTWINWILKENPRPTPNGKTHDGNGKPASAHDKFLAGAAAFIRETEQRAAESQRDSDAPGEAGNPLLPPRLQ